ncbi:MAG: hypothetical protein ACYDHH_10400 [Solirubrobacteraceae bacterium]
MKTVLAITALALAVAGCGGNSPTQTSAGSSQSPKGDINAAYRFSACMRNHGLPNFPDPVVHTSAGSQSVGIKVTPGETSSPAFASAQKACQGSIPGPGPNNGNSAAQDRQHLETLVAFTHCLHSHGYPTFPSPNAQGRLDPATIASSGVDVHSSQFFGAARGCLSVTNGTITPAMLSRAIAKIP